VRLPTDNRVVAWVSGFADRPASVENYLFPGLLACILGALGLAVFLRRSRAPDESGTLEVLTLAFCSVASLVLLVVSFGSSATLRGRTVALPYHLVENLPGFAGIRVTSRFVAFPLLTLTLFAALGLERLLASHPRRERILLVTVCAAFVLVETSIPIQIDRVPSDPQQTAVNAALARRASGAVVELPIVSAAHGGDIWAAVEAPRMWLATIDGNPRLNGYSGAEPPGFDRLARVMNRDFPSARRAGSSRGCRIALTPSGASGMPT
jgi:hypothetical protein